MPNRCDHIRSAKSHLNALRKKPNSEVALYFFYAMEADLASATRCGEKATWREIGTDAAEIILRTGVTSLVELRDKILKEALSGNKLFTRSIIDHWNEEPEVGLDARFSKESLKVLENHFKRLCGKRVSGSDFQREESFTPNHPVPPGPYVQ